MLMMCYYLDRGRSWAPVIPARSVQIVVYPLWEQVPAAVSGFCLGYRCMWCCIDFPGLLLSVALAG